jgi:hypothetical protein
MLAENLGTALAPPVEVDALKSFEYEVLNGFAESTFTGIS